MVPFHNFFSRVRTPYQSYESRRSRRFLPIANGGVSCLTAVTFVVILTASLFSFRTNQNVAVLSNFEVRNDIGNLGLIHLLYLSLIVIYTFVIPSVLMERSLQCHYVGCREPGVGMNS